eukprot:jgi/Mesvir1/16610/Mv10144-RA.1
MGVLAITQVSGAGFHFTLGYLYNSVRDKPRIGYDMLKTDKDQVLVFTIPQNTYIVDGVLIDQPTEVSITFTPAIGNATPPLLPAIKRAVFDIYNGGVLTKAQELVRDPDHPVFDSIEMYDLVNAEFCSLVISIPYEQETPQSSFTVRYKIDNEDVGYFLMSTAPNGDFTISMSGLYQVLKNKGSDTTTLQKVTFTLPSYSLLVNGQFVSTQPVDIALRVVDTLLEAELDSNMHVCHIQGLTNVTVDVVEDGVTRNSQVIASSPDYQSTFLYLSQIAQTGGSGHTIETIAM